MTWQHFAAAALVALAAALLLKRLTFRTARASNCTSCGSCSHANTPPQHAQLVQLGSPPTQSTPGRSP
ncbi:MAG: hypothetical protein RL215_1094 [Planctomycetota bacterium]